jgi:tellurite resistance protein TerC
MAMFRYLKYSLVLILAFVGVKMLLVQVYHEPNLVSLGIILGTLAGGVAASLLATWREARRALQEPPGGR